MKKNWIMRTAILLLVVLFGTCSMLGTTLARYTYSTGDLSDSARVAKFTYSVKDANGTAFTTSGAEIDIFATRITESTGVRPGYLAPGVSGSFPIVVKNDSEVMVCVSEMTAAVTNSGTTTTTPDFQFSTDNSTWTTAAAAMSQIAASYGNLGKNAEVTKTVYWRWNPSDGGAAFATADNDANTTLLTLTATISQVD